MSTPAEKFLDWLQLYVNTAGYSISRGMWSESAANSGKKYVAIWINSGRAPMAGEVQYPQIRVIVSGTVGGRDKGETPAVETFADGILNAAVNNHVSGCIANVRPSGSIQGPYYTDAGRPFYEINFELTI
jgi:hypothetical protein